MSGSAPVAFLTGATGFVGRALVPRLERGGYRVHALVRGGSDREPLAGCDVRWHVGDLLDHASVARAAAQAAADGEPALAVHNAAVISYARGDGEQQTRVNVDGSRAVHGGLLEAGFERRVHVGSVVAVGTQARGAAPLDEDAPWDPRLECVDYVRTKRRADELALDSGAVVVDPGAIFGPGARHSNTTRFVERVSRSGAPPLVPPGGLAVVDVDDVVEGIVLAGERGRPGRRYLLVESNRSLRELFTLAASMTGRRKPWATIPPGAWAGLVAVAGGLERLVPLGPLGAQGQRLLAETYAFDASRARDELGWRPRPFEKTLRRTLDWLA